MKAALFSEVDAGCLMFEKNDARWIIEHPINGYMPTSSRMWDVLIEHPEQPHSLPVKFMGSFKAKIEALSFVKTQLKNSINYFNSQAISNEFYYEDYTKK